jgi:hypothetical protein
MKILGTVITIIGVVGLIITSINYANQTDKFSLLGLNITVSQGNIIPIIVAGVVLFLGLILLIVPKKV